MNMHIDNVSNKNFQGKFIYSKYLSEKEKQFAKNIVNQEIDGISNKKFLADKNFDILLQAFNNRKTIHPKLKIQPLIKYIIKGGYCKGQTNTNYNPLELRLDERVENGGKMLRKHITDTEEFIEKYYSTHYYTKMQKWQMKLKVLFEKI